MRSVHRPTSSQIAMLIGLALAAAAVALAIAGCGGDSDEDKITTVIEEAVIGEDPERVCRELFTQDLLEELTDERGEAAQEECVEETEGSGAEGPEVSDVEIDGETATAKVSFSVEGEGQRASVDLVEEGDDWKIDAIK